MTRYLEQINSPQDLKKLKISELSVYAEEVRDYIVETVRKRGGHLSSNLGAVELTVALHYVFDSPKDKILFDVGHQAYTHKIITAGATLLKSLGATRAFPDFPVRKRASTTLSVWDTAVRLCRWDWVLLAQRDIVNDD